MADAQGDASAAADGLEYDCYGLPIFPLDQDDETMNPTLVRSLPLHQLPPPYSFSSFNYLCDCRTCDEAAAWDLEQVQ